MTSSLGLLEVGNLAPTFIVADRAVKAADVAIVGVESTDSGALLVKIKGSVGAVREAVAVGVAIAKKMGTSIESTIINGPDADAVSIACQPPVFSPLVGVYDGYIPQGKSTAMNSLGLLETQGLSALLHATDEMLKSANVRIVGKEKIGGGFVTIMVTGDLSDVQSAIEAGKRTVERLGARLILADVISNPHQDLTSLLPAK